MFEFAFRAVGYFLGMAVTDIAIGLWKESKMRREFAQYENENGGTISAHTVTEETAGPVTVVGGSGRDTVPGDVLIETDRPDVYQVAQNLDGYSTADSADDSEDGGEFPYDPADHTVTDVLAYLDTADAAERERVITAERDGKNRSGVVSYGA